MFTVCAEGTQVDVKPGSDSMYNVLINYSPLSEDDYGLFQSKSSFLNS